MATNNLPIDYQCTILALTKIFTNHDWYKLVKRNTLVTNTLQ